MENVANIIGVELKPLKTFPDDRGFFREVVRAEEPIFRDGRFAQWSHSKMTQNVVKAWHFHHKQTDWWYLALGRAQVALVDNREESSTYRSVMEFVLDGSSGADPKEQVLVRIPPGVLHGLKILSDEAHLFYVTSEVYDPLDEGRIPFNSQEIPYSWGEGVITVERDRKLHIPPYPRELIS
ncbi:MAG: dTDP-4-dehydrorhamnose 3,5-epimerase family protein [Bdellovibrionales bacterium]|nr:dTDP-4-dehydrorhamnose 3,5-epimerase family protein [Bdellovibrionales bacterium]